MQISAEPAEKYTTQVFLRLQSVKFEISTSLKVNTVLAQLLARVHNLKLNNG